MTILVNPTVICNILTLRYNPEIKPLLPIKTWKDFQPNNAVISIEHIENTISGLLKQKMNFPCEQTGLKSILRSKINSDSALCHFLMSTTFDSKTILDCGVFCIVSAKIIFFKIHL